MWVRYVAISVAKVVFAGWGLRRCSHPWVCGSGCFGEKRECLSKVLPRDEVAGCRSRILHRSRHRQYWRWLKVVPECGVLNSSNSYSTWNPWSKRIDARVHKLDGFPHGGSASAIEESGQSLRLSWTKKFWGRESVWWLSPIWCCSEWWSGENRISHPDWAKICVDPNLQIY